MFARQEVAHDFADDGSASHPTAGKDADTDFARIVSIRITSYNVCYTKLLRG